MPTYISKQGLQDLKDELRERTKVKRREIAEKIGVATQQGDLSENFEYHEAKEQQGLNEARVIQLKAMIFDAVIVEQTSGGDRIGLGSTFIAKCDGKEKTFTIVGFSEADPLSGKISNESPIGMAFLGQSPGDLVEVEVPSGVMSYTILKIE